MPETLIDFNTEALPAADWWALDAQYAEAEPYAPRHAHQQRAAFFAVFHRAKHRR
jgi:hypothetical protein